MSAPGRLVGQVYKWDPRRGFGFARTGAPPCSYFIHAVEVEGGQVEVGCRVEFIPVPSPRGPRAQRVCRVATGTPS